MHNLIEIADHLGGTLKVRSLDVGLIRVAVRERNIYNACRISAEASKALRKALKRAEYSDSSPRTLIEIADLYGDTLKVMPFLGGRIGISLREDHRLAVVALSPEASKALRKALKQAERELK